MKTCFKCQQTLPLIEFYPHTRMKDGHLNKCRACARKDAHLRMGKIMSDPSFQAMERERHRNKAAIYRAANDIRLAARARVQKAVRNKILIPLPCEICGANKTEAHHDDYQKPLDVRWLCREHHKQLHMDEKKLTDLKTHE